MKKFKTVFFILLMMYSLVGCGNSEHSGEKLKESINIEQLSWIDEGVWADHQETGLLVKNNNDVSVDVSIEVKCYDDMHNSIDTRSTELCALAPNTEFFILCNFEDGIDKIEYTFTCEKSEYKGLVVDEDIFISHGTGYPMTIHVKNLSGKETIECNCSVIFYDKSGNIIGADSVEMHDGQIPDDETVMEEVDTALDAAGMDVYLNSYINED